MSLADLRARAEERLSTFRLAVDSITDADIRFIADFLTALDEQEARDAVDIAVLDEIRSRRARASLADLENRSAAAAAVTTSDDVDTINRIARERGTVAQRLASAHTDVWEDFSRGERCSVCGKTTAQAAAENYNCTEEC